jgi:hypothetical protein
MLVYFVVVWSFVGHSVHFLVIWYIFGHLVYFVVIWYNFPRFGKLYPVTWQPWFSAISIQNVFIPCKLSVWLLLAFETEFQLRKNIIFADKGAAASNESSGRRRRCKKMF